MTAAEFATALGDLGLRPNTFAALVPWDQKTLVNWLEAGVPLKQDRLLKQSLRKVAVLVAPGGDLEHMTKRGLGRPFARVRGAHA